MSRTRVKIDERSLTRTFHTIFVVVFLNMDEMSFEVLQAERPRIRAVHAGDHVGFIVELVDFFCLVNHGAYLKKQR